MTHRFGARWLLAFMLLALGFAACRKQENKSSDATLAAPKSNALPALEINDDTPNLLLTWVDEKGDFHVVQKPADVPKDARQQVRVVVTNKEDGTGQLVYVANLSEVTPAGNYRVKTATRATWDEFGASRRKSRLEALAPSAEPPPSSSSAAPDAPKKVNAGGMVAIIYGASWCKPCHDAAAYLRQRGVTVVMKDIDENQVANAEMQKKLSRVGRSGSSIPVIDLMGQILIGFSPMSLDQAISAARAAKPL